MYKHTQDTAVLLVVTSLSLLQKEAAFELGWGPIEVLPATQYDIHGGILYFQWGL